VSFPRKRESRKEEKSILLRLPLTREQAGFLLPQECHRASSIRVKCYKYLWVGDTGGDLVQITHLLWFLHSV